MRHLHEDARAVAGVPLGPLRAPMLEVQKHLERLGDDVVGSAAFDVGDEAEAAGVVLERRVVQPLLRGRP